MQEDLAFHLTIVDIDTDEQLRRQYGDRIPVVLLDDRELLSGKVTAGDLRKAIKKARWRPYKPDSVPYKTCAYTG